jgi:hypothetical protein
LPMPSLRPARLAVSQEWKVSESITHGNDAYSLS